MSVHEFQQLASGAIIRYLGKLSMTIHPHYQIVGAKKLQHTGYGVGRKQ
jgi:hypothetical protein